MASSRLECMCNPTQKLYLYNGFDYIRHAATADLPPALIFAANVHRISSFIPLSHGREAWSLRLLCLAMNRAMLPAVRLQVKDDYCVKLLFAFEASFSYTQ